MAIFKRLLAAPSEADGADLKLRITEMLIGCLDDALSNPPLASEEYFNLLTQLLTAGSSESETDKLKLAPQSAVDAHGSLGLFSAGAKPRISPRGQGKLLEVPA